MPRVKRNCTIRGYAPEYISLRLKMSAVEAGCSESDALVNILALHYLGCTLAEHEAKNMRAALVSQVNSLTQK